MQTTHTQSECVFASTSISGLIILTVILYNREEKPLVGL